MDEEFDKKEQEIQEKLESLLKQKQVILNSIKIRTILDRDEQITVDLLELPVDSTILPLLNQRRS